MSIGVGTPMTERSFTFLVFVAFASACSDEAPTIPTAEPLQCWGNAQRDYSPGELVEIARNCRRINAVYQAIDAYNAALRREPKLDDARQELAAILTALERHADAASVADGGTILPPPK